MPPLAGRIEQLICAKDGVDREGLLRGCEGVAASTIDEAISSLLLAGHAYLDGNLYRAV
jgi:hypothetical protein